MFTGIVEEMGRVEERRGPRLVIGSRLVLDGTKVGDSIAVSGACLTVTALKDAAFCVDITPETERRTTLKALVPGCLVNLERPLAYGGRVGGHLVQGHVDGVGEVLAVTPEGNALLLEFKIATELLRYVVPKGFVAVDGVSLTVVERRASSFTVSVIPYTRDHTTLGRLQLGDPVNVEPDMLAKYVEQLLGGRGALPGSRAG